MKNFILSGLIGMALAILVVPLLTMNTVFDQYLIECVLIGFVLLSAGINKFVMPVPKPTR